MRSVLCFSGDVKNCLYSHISFKAEGGIVCLFVVLVVKPRDAAFQTSTLPTAPPKTRSLAVFCFFHRRARSFCFVPNLLVSLWNSFKTLSHPSGSASHSDTAGEGGGRVRPKYIEGRILLKQEDQRMGQHPCVFLSCIVHQILCLFTPLRQELSLEAILVQEFESQEDL